ncbi:MAG: LicD family protein [Selenomonadaceae bacterium]|nr:LicD family protein [Selenomonadaceae bacterium]
MIPNPPPSDLPTKIRFDESFFEEEERCNFHVSRRRKELWAILLDLWQEFDRVCRKYNLTYYLDGGTLLGAVRHKGFIPWDDDIDLAMFRKDYNKLLEIGPTEFKHPYFFQHGFNEPRYCYAHHVKIRNALTLGESGSLLAIPLNHGVFLDVFALDVFNDDPDKVQAQELELREYHRLMYSIVKQFKVSTLATDDATKKLYEALLHLHRQFEECASRYENEQTSSVANFILFFNMNHRRTHEVKNFGEPLYVPFESFNAPIPSNADAVLRDAYGDDYMTPKQGAPSFHGDLFFDARHSHAEVLGNIIESLRLK